MSHAKTQSRKGGSLFFAALRLCVSFFCLALPALAAPDPNAAATVVVFNEQDAVSVDLAGYYAEKRGIPFDHLVGLKCPMEESISREAYDETIAGPLRAAFLAHGWWKTEADINAARVVESRIRYVALIRGIPLKIGAVAVYPGDRPLSDAHLNHNEAAVDSELAVLGLASPQISGVVENPCYGKPPASPDEPAPWLLRVCRLDAARPGTVRRMIDDALAVEKTGLWGFAYVDSRGIKDGAMGQGDEWFRRAAADLAADGMPCIHDATPALFPEHYPLRRAAFYLGWYAGEVEGVFKDPAVRFAPGAVAVHLHSFSASSLREPLQGWCAPLLERGAAATLGNVYEPYLMFTPHLEMFEQQLQTGAAFADAAYAAQPVLSWMTTFIGDPLYRPFKAWQQPALKPPAEARELAAFREGALLWAGKGRSAGEPWLRARGKALQSGVILEGLGLLQASAGDAPAALATWTQARPYYKEEADQLRCVLHAIALLRGQQKNAAALALVREQLARHPQADAAPLFAAIERELAPPPSPAKGPQSKPDQ